MNTRFDTGDTIMLEGRIIQITKFEDGNTIYIIQLEDSSRTKVKFRDCADNPIPDDRLQKKEDKKEVSNEEN